MDVFNVFKPLPPLPAKPSELYINVEVHVEPLPKPRQLYINLEEPAVVRPAPPPRVNSKLSKIVRFHPNLSPNMVENDDSIDEMPRNAVELVVNVDYSPNSEKLCLIRKKYTIIFFRVICLFVLVGAIVCSALVAVYAYYCRTHICNNLVSFFKILNMIEEEK